MINSCKIYPERTQTNFSLDNILETFEDVPDFNLDELLNTFAEVGNLPIRPSQSPGIADLFPALEPPRYKKPVSRPVHIHSTRKKKTKTHSNNT